MSNKKHPPKPAPQKPESEAVGEVITVQPLPSADEAVAAPEQESASFEKPPAEPTTEAPSEVAADTAAVVTPASPEEQDQNTPDEADASTVPAVIETVAEEPTRPDATSRDRFSIRLTRAVNAIQTSGKAESVQALNKLEMLVGDLRNALPAAIEAAGDVSVDDHLEHDLQSMFNAL